MSTWWPARQGLAALALLSAALTGALGIGLGGPGWTVSAAEAYLLVTILAVYFPPAIAAQVVGGQLFLGALMLQQPDFGPMLLLPGIATVIVTAELLAAVARMDTPVRGAAGGYLPRTGLSALIGGGAFVAVALLSALPGPTGFLAVLVASGACVVLAWPMFSRL